MAPQDDTSAGEPGKPTDPLISNYSAIGALGESSGVGREAIKVDLLRWEVGADPQGHGG